MSIEVNQQLRLVPCERKWQRKVKMLAASAQRVIRPPHVKHTTQQPREKRP